MVEVNNTMFNPKPKWGFKLCLTVAFLLLSNVYAFAQTSTLDVIINSSSTVVKTGGTVQFFDQSAGSPTQWTWTFPGATPGTSTDQNPIVTYPTNGVYSVTLEIRNAGGDVVTETFTNYVSVISMQTFWWNDAVFYEVFIRSFKDSNGDGKGDLLGLIDKLDYLNDGDPSTHTDLGVTGIWLMPVQQSPSYHGYDITDYRTVEQDYGSNPDFQTFMTEAHRRGIKVIVDYVMNHTSSQHPWFVSSTNSTDNKRDWYVWENPAPSVTGPWGQQVWYPKNGSNYYGIFWSEMPDLNYNTQAVKDEMFDVARFWLEDMGVDGFRLDAARYIIENASSLQDTPETIDFWQDYTAHNKAINPNAFSVGEVWTNTDQIQPYVTNNGLDYCFEFDLASAVMNAASSGNVATLKTQMDKVMTTYPFLQFGTFLTNHDMNRVMDQLAKNVPKAKVASDLLLTLPGIPYVYYGEEIGMTGSKPDENIRTPMQWDNTAQAGFTTGTPWRAVNADYTTKNVAAQSSDATSMLSRYRKLIAVRNNQVALRKGNYVSISSNSIYGFAFLRQYENENIVVVSNLSASTITNSQITLTHGGITPGNYVLVELMGGGQLSIVIDNMGGFSNFTIPSIAGKSTLIYKLMDAADVSTTVTFEVDMNNMISGGDFDPLTETVDIVADFNNFGLGIQTLLSDANGDGIYTVSISNLNVGSKINYKYRINGVNDGREEFAGTGYYREHIVLEGNDVVLDVYQKSVTTDLQHALLSKVYVYPVPANKELYIEYPSDYVGEVHYSLVDVLGTEKMSSSFVSSSSAQQSISTEELSSGIYVLTVEYQGAKKAFRVVIQK